MNTLAKLKREMGEKYDEMKLKLEEKKRELQDSDNEQPPPQSPLKAPSQEP